MRTCTQIDVFAKSQIRNGTSATVDVAATGTIDDLTFYRCKYNYAVHCLHCIRGTIIIFGRQVRILPWWGGAPVMVMTGDRLQLKSC